MTAAVKYTQKLFIPVHLQISGFEEFQSKKLNMLKLVTRPHKITVCLLAEVMTNFHWTIFNIYFLNNTLSCLLEKLSNG